MQTEIGRAALAYRVWRKNNPDRGVAPPAELQREIVKLLEEHSWEEVCKTVGISRSGLSYWRRRHREELQLAPRPRGRPKTVRRAKPHHGTEQTPGFIELPITAGPGVDVELRLPSGVVVAARANSDPTAIGELFARVITAIQASGAAE